MDIQDPKEAVHQRIKAKKAECARSRRSRMSDKERTKRNEYERKRRAKLRDDSEVELKKRRIKNTEGQRRRRAEMDEEELKKRRIKNAKYQREKRAEMDEEKLMKVRNKHVESHHKRIAKMNEEEVERFKQSRIEYQRRYRKQLRDGALKLQAEREVQKRIRLFVLLISGFKSHKPAKYLAARKFFSNILSEIGDLHAEIANLKTQLKESVSDAVQNAVKVHRNKEQSSGRCQSFTFVEIPMLAEPNKIIQHHLNRNDNAIDPLFREPGRGEDESAGLYSLDGNTNENVELRDQTQSDENYDTFVLRPYDERVICEEKSDRSKLECLICFKTFSTSLGLTIHQKEHKNHTKGFKCSVCRQSFKSYNLMTTHYLQLHSFEDLDKEMESEQTDEELERAVHHLGFLLLKKCSICFKTFATEKPERVGLSTYSQHIITDHSDNKELLKYFAYICSHCDKPHTFLHHLESHWKTTCFDKWKSEDGNNKQAIVCETCGMRFSNENSLFSHIKIFHSVEVKEKVVCEQCGKELENENTLSRHIALIHQGRQGEYKFSCEHCEKSLKLKEI